MNKHIVLLISLLVASVAVLFISAARTMVLVNENAKIKSELVDATDKEKSCLKHFVYENKISMMAKTLIVSYNLSKWEARYYSIVFNDFSTNYNIPWEIYAAIIKIESAFNPTLVSVKQARGLMQILESTGKETADKIGIRYINGQSAWNEFLNISIGCSYLSMMIQDSGMEKGVKQYLGGPAYAKNAERDKKIADYIKSYYSDVMSEYEKLCYVYRGIVSELTMSNDTLYLKESNTRFDVELNPFSTVTK